MQIAPSTYYAARARRPSRRALRDEQVKVQITRVHEENYGVYGSRKVHVALRREDVVVDGTPVARCTVRRLMTELGLRGVNRARTPVTTVRAKGTDDRPDLVKRLFTADAPDRLWVADITYCRTFAGWTYVAFVTDVYSRRIVGWQISTNMRVDLALDALNMGLWTRQHDGRPTDELTHHSDKGSQYLALRYTDRLAEAGAALSVGTTGDSYDNAMAEALNSLFKAELVRNKGPWRDVEHLEVAVAEWVDWYNHRRIHHEIGDVPPVEYEQTFHRQNPVRQPA